MKGENKINNMFIKFILNKPYKHIIRWISARNNLRETFDRMNNIYNIADMKNGIMKEIFK